VHFQLPGEIDYYRAEILRMFRISCDLDSIHKMKTNAAVRWGGREGER
jgi:hypothetical protein